LSGAVDCVDETVGLAVGCGLRFDDVADGGRRGASEEPWGGAVEGRALEAGATETGGGTVLA